MGVSPNAAIICAGDSAPASPPVHRHRELEIADTCFNPGLTVQIADDSDLTRCPRQNLHGAALPRGTVHRHAQAGFETRHRKGKASGNVKRFGLRCDDGGNVSARKNWTPRLGHVSDLRPPICERIEIGTI
jgi:hypothetical protein